MTRAGPARIGRTRRRHWSADELAALENLAAIGLTATQAADRLAELGYPVRNLSDVSEKLRALRTRAA